ncbi:hypothetical protein NQ315_004085 [Exocentrus adspersus]|uniref:C2 domain-containing protein n=1 Tax=Exocentrus adspersus TaxID=1586481 RepID=A0AAV8W688_9CUCU|nr:hypothetical protein NQ315_004085 [Exocentrus adspersus]
MAEKTETFLITVAVLEGRHYIWTNMDSAVVVKVDQKKRCTAVKYSTDCPLYNEYFVFEFSTTLENMLEKRIMLTVIQPRSCCRRRKVLGDLNIDMATLWSQENHQFYHKWAILGKKDNFSGPRGYLKVDISMLAKGQVSKIPFGVLNDEIEGNLLLPDGLYQERQKAIYQFDIYKGENLEEKPNISVKDNKTQGGGPNTYIEVTFAGQKVRTSIKKNTHSPVFNERLTIMDLFPPLSQRIKIEICYQESCKKTINAARFLDLKLISNDKEEGFLPTFGPTYLYMYFNHNLGGFAGKILVSMDTELHDILPTDCKTTGTLVQSIPAIIEEQRFEDVILFGMIFGATAISKSCFDRVVSFRMTFGNTLIQKNADAGENCIMNSTNSMKPKKFSKEYYYLPVENEKPSLVITKNLPSCKKRMYNSNMLFKITKELVSILQKGIDAVLKLNPQSGTLKFFALRFVLQKLKIKSIQEQFESRGYRLSCGEIYDIVIDTLYFIRSSARKYIDIVEEYSFENGTKLDRERQKMCLKEMTSILDRVTKMCANRAKKETLGKIQTLCNRIEALVFDIQDCWPDIHLWMIFGSRKVAFCQIPAREILYSPIDEEKGEYCGKMRTICFYPHPKDKTNLSCKMDLLLWLGAERHKNDCFTSIPQGFTFDRDSVLLSRKILAEQKYEFYLRAHIFQGKISPGFDRTGLADTYVRVVIRDKQKETRPINAKLNPLWDQTLILPDLAFYGSKSYLMENVPNVLMEVWDRDQCKRDDTVGRTLVTPLMKFRDDPYAPPKFPPKLSWIKTYDGAEVLGEILAAFEYIEIPKPEDEFQIPLKEAICPIPPDIKPQMVLHRIEVLFWVNRPRISVICEEAILVSETIENAKKHPNFINKCKSMDVVLPLEKMYAPPLVMKIQDSRRFGIYSYAGVHISDIHSYVFYPLTREERNRRLSEYSLVKRNSDSSMGKYEELSKSFTTTTLIMQTGSFQDMKYQKVHFKDDTPLATLPRYNSSWWKNYLKGLCSYQSKFPYYTCDIPDEQEVVKPPKKKFNLENLFKNLCKCSRKTKSEAGKSVSSLGTYESLPQYDPELEEDFDWWTKFYASLSTAQEDLLCEAADRKPHTLKASLHLE